MRLDHALVGGLGQAAGGDNRQADPFGEGDGGNMLAPSVTVQSCLSFAAALDVADAINVPDSSQILVAEQNGRIHFQIPELLLFIIVSQIQTHSV